MNRERWIWASAEMLCGFIVACAPNPVINPALTDSAVYEAFFSGGRQPGDTVYVKDSSLTFDAFSPEGAGPDRELLNSRLTSEGVPNELASSLARASKVKQPSRTLSLPEPVHFLEASEMKEIFSQNPRTGWDEFYRRYPRAKGYQAFSPIGYSVDRTSALFYHEQGCGGLCGTGELVWVARSPDGQWKVKKQIGLWIS
jgi:hypothetical protein